MNIRTSLIGRVRVLSVTARVDQEHAKALEIALAPYLLNCTTKGEPIVLDFVGVDYISSVGLRVLLLAAKQVKNQGGRIAIAALTPVVAEVFKVSRFDLVLTVFASVALASVELAA